MSIDVTPRPMTADQARATIDAIKERVEDIRELVLELHERQGWKALGYKSWRDCVTKEFDQSATHLYRQLQAALIERELSPIGDKPKPIPESHVRPLAKLPTPEERKEAFEEAKSTAKDGKVKAKDVQKAVNRRLGPKEKAAVEARENRVNGQSRVNGVIQDDPPDIAKRRASGELPPDVVPDVVEVDTVEAADDSIPTVDETELSDEAWLAKLPIHAKMSGSCLKIFERDALLYRVLEPARKLFQHHAVRALGASRRKGPEGEYAYRTSVFLKLDHPKHWKLCPTTENGGCGSSGTIGLIGQCPKCRGRGYWIL